MAQQYTLFQLVLLFPLKPRNIFTSFDPNSDGTKQKWNTVARTPFLNMC